MIQERSYSSAIVLERSSFQNIWKNKTWFSCSVSSKLENKVFSVLPGTPRDYNLSKEEWLATRDFAEDRNIIIKPADKGPCTVLWVREDYLAEVEKQLQDVHIYEDTDFKESDLVKLVEKSNTMFKFLRRKNLSQKKNLSILFIYIKSQQILVILVSF